MHFQILIFLSTLFGSDVSFNDYYHVVVFLPGWTCTQGPRLNRALQIDAGLGQVVALDTSRRGYFLSGSSWTRLPNANLKHISVGQAGMWGTHVSDYIYKYVDGSWARVPGKTKHFQLQLLLCKSIRSNMINQRICNQFW